MSAERNRRNRGDGLALLRSLQRNSTPLVFFDPQYRRLLDKMGYGNDESARSKLPQMAPELIHDMLEEMPRVVRPQGHLMCWMDKYEMLEWTHQLPEFQRVDMITWEKARWGNGYRSRRKSEFLIIYQRLPARARGVWTDHSIPDVWGPEREAKEVEGLTRDAEIGFDHEPSHPHAKPLGLQSRLIRSVTKLGQLVVDPCAGGFSVLEACRLTGRNFLGVDIRG